jgi:AcrR family transcriptional regulator
VAKKRALRADAERNRQHVLAIAQEVFAAEGLAVPIDEIARRAGLGIGTLYRHFPTKEALFLAIVIERMERLVAEARALAGGPDPGDAFFGFLTRMVHEASAKKDFMKALSGTRQDLGSTLAGVKARYRAALTLLLERAQASGAVRQDVSVLEVHALLTGASVSLEQLGKDATDARERLLAVVRDGLRPRPARAEQRGARARPPRAPRKRGSGEHSHGRSGR